MTDMAISSEVEQKQERQARIAARLSKRHAAEKRFRLYGLLAIGAALLFLVFLFGTVLSNGATAFMQTEMRLTLNLDQEKIDPERTGDPKVIGDASYSLMIKKRLLEMFPDLSRSERRDAFGLISNGAQYEIRDQVMANPDLVGQTVDFWVPASDDIDMLNKGYIDTDLVEDNRRVTDVQLGLVEKLRQDDALEKRFNTRFFSNGDSREPELAGI